jgi:hypothetical protein
MIEPTFTQKACPECLKRDQALALVKARNRVLRDMLKDLSRAIDQYLDLGDGEASDDRSRALLGVAGRPKAAPNG